MDRDVEHLRLLSIFHFVLAGLHAMLGCLGIIYVIAGAVFVSTPQMFPSHNGQPGPPPALFGGMFIVFRAFFLLLGWVIASLLACAGYFLGQRRHYMFCLVMACVSCIFMPLGTILGVFTIMVLQRPKVRVMFGQPETLS
jgi:hypothetical protein